VVWEVRERHDPHRVFACKVISRRLRVVQDEMHNEVRALSSVRCEHIVSFIESYGDENSFYIILEKLNGGELFDDITKRER
jgi:serine/threonine protein kinase